MAAAAVAVLVAWLGGGWLFMNRQAEPEIQPASHTRTAERRTELDLRKFAVTRSEQGSEQAAPVSLPIGVDDLTILLSVGSEPGTYDIQLLDANLRRRSISARCRAERTNWRSDARAMIGGCFRRACGESLPIPGV
jgi:hypothetical protein